MFLRASPLATLACVAGLMLAAPGCGDDPPAGPTSGTATSGSGATSTSTGAGGGGGGGGGGGAGGGEQPGVRSFQSGARLRATVLDGGDDAVRFISWFDSEANTRCSFGLDEEGVVRCMPDGVYVIGYLDAECTKPVGRRMCGSTPAALASEIVMVEEPHCPGTSNGSAALKQVHRSRARALGAPIDPPAVVYAGPTCSPSGTNPAWSYFEVGDVVAPTAFVAQEAIERVPVGEGLEVERRVAKDGSWEFVEIVDAKGDHCSAREVGGAQRCLPRFSAYLSPNFSGMAFLSETCSADPVAVYAEPELGCAPPAVVVQKLIDDSCGSPAFAFHAPGADVSPAALHAVNGNVCGPLTPQQASRSYYEVGGALAPATFGALSVSTRGSGRAQVLGVESGDGTWLGHGGWASNGLGLRDAAIDGGASCQLYHFADGLHRCVTGVTELLSDQFFLDDQCTEALVSRNKPAGGCPAGPPLRHRVLGSVGSGCSVVPNNGSYAEVHGLSEHAGDVYVKSATCTPAPASIHEGMDFWAPTGPVPLATILTFEIRTE